MKGHIPILDINYYHFEPALIKFFTNDAIKIIENKKVDCLVAIEDRVFILAAAKQYASNLRLKLMDFL